MCSMCRGHFLAACIGLLLSWHYHGLSVATEPGFLDFDNLPETNFSCEGKVIGGYYADTETGCQMFHVCTIGQKGEITDIKFLCLNGTVFDQETRVCERLDEVDCSKSESFYDLNLELYGNQGAEFGIQPENDESQDAELCEEEDEEDCKTEEHPAPVKQPSPTEQVQVSNEDSEDEEETTTQQPLTSSTTSRRPVTSTSYPSTTVAPQILQFPSSSPETIAALLALHKAFTQSLQQHSTNKDKINPPKLTGFVESLNPSKTAQQFEIKSTPTLPPPPPRLPTPFGPKTQTQFNVPQNPSKTQYQSVSNHHFQSQQKHQFQSLPTPQYQNPQKPQFHSPAKPQFQNQPKPQFQNQPKPQFQNLPKSQPLRPVTFSKPIQTTSDSFGNSPFHHSFHISSQSSHFPDPSYQDQYSDHDSQPSTQPQTEAPKQYDFNDYEDDYYDEKPHSSTITPYLLHQIKVNQVQNANQAKVSSVSHGNYAREVSNPTSSKPFNIPSFRSVTTPGIAIITTTSTTSSSSVKTSKPVQSAIQPQKGTLTTAEFVDTLLHPPSNNTHNLSDPPQSYDDYIESDVRHDPFYKDVPKIGRSKRSLKNNIVSDNSVTLMDYKVLTKLKDTVVKNVFQNSSETVLNAILYQYCKDQVNSSDSLVTFCSLLSGNFTGSKLSDEWKIVIPNGSNDYLYLVKTISSSNDYQHSTSNIILLVNLPHEFKLLRDSILKNVEKEQESSDVLKDLDLHNVNSSIHHRFKRVRRNKSEVYLETQVKKHSKRVNVPTKKTKSVRKRRQTILSESDEKLNLRKSAQQENRRVTRPSSRHSEGELRRTVSRQRLTDSTEPSEEVDRTRVRVRVRQRRPTSRKQQLQPTGLQTPAQGVEEEVKVTPTPAANLKSSWDDARSNPDLTSVISSPNKRVLERPTSKRRGQGVRYHFSEGVQQADTNSSTDVEVEVSTTYPFNLKPGTQFSCDDKIKGGYYADVEAECYGYFICSQGEINGPLLKSHFWCGPTTKFNQRSRTCQTEANVACSVSHRYFHLNKDILSLPDPDDDIKDSFEPSKVQS